MKCSERTISLNREDLWWRGQVVLLTRMLRVKPFYNLEERYRIGKQKRWKAKKVSEKKMSGTYRTPFPPASSLHPLRAGVWSGDLLGSIPAETDWKPKDGERMVRCTCDYGNSVRCSQPGYLASGGHGRRLRTENSSLSRQCRCPIPYPRRCSMKCTYCLLVALP